ncbi:UpxY family transcription antiterminator [Gramella sp. BOM4]|nr:UpxY family transcription antiterminator [Christiangramia bathymodioli]
MPWYVVRTKPRHEIKSAVTLEDLGLEVYCPVITEVKQWSDRKKKVITPLFRCYLFVNMDISNRNRVFEAPGVIGFMTWQGKPAIARNEEIKAVKDWLNNEAIDEVSIRELSKGDFVKIKAGKFADKTAVIEEVGNKRLKLILPDLGWKLTANIREIV